MREDYGKYGPRHREIEHLRETYDDNNRDYNHRHQRLSYKEYIGTWPRNRDEERDIGDDGEHHSVSSLCLYDPLPCLSTIWDEHGNYVGKEDGSDGYEAFMIPEIQGPILRLYQLRRIHKKREVVIAWCAVLWPSQEWARCDGDYDKHQRRRRALVIGKTSFGARRTLRLDDAKEKENAVPNKDPVPRIASSPPVSSLAARDINNAKDANNANDVNDAGVKDDD